jgi:hypothetical protein
LTARVTVHRGDPTSENECERLQPLAIQIFHDDRAPWLWGTFGFVGLQQAGEFHIQEFQVYR